MPDRILIIRLSAIGDTVHVLPSLQALRKGCPDAVIGWLVEDRAAAYVAGAAGLDHVHLIPRRRWKHKGYGVHVLSDMQALRREIRAVGYDTALDFQGLTKSGFFALFSGARRRIGWSGADSREINPLFINDPVTPQSAHIIDRNLELARHAGASPGPVEYGFPEFAQAGIGVAASLRDLLPAPGSPFAILFPGAGWPTKRWPPEHFGGLARLLRDRWGLSSVVLWGPGEEADAAAICAAAGGAAIMGPATSLEEAAEFVRRCQVFAGGDTGLTHVAAALGKLVIGIYGAPDPARNGPYGERVLVLTRDLECRPCWKTQCPYGHLKCLRELTPESVLPSLEDFFRRHPAALTPGAGPRLPLDGGGD